MDDIRTLNVKIPNNISLDFGCGVGRLTQPLANYFTKVYGIDISPTMIKMANDLYLGDNCQFILNETDNLKLFDDDTIDFIYSNITLLHMEPKYSKSYIKEFMRIINSEGIIIFSLTTKAIGVNKLKFGIIRKLLIPVIQLIKGHIMELYVVKEQEITRLVGEQNFSILSIKRSEKGGYINSEFFIVKKS